MSASWCGLFMTQMCQCHKKNLWTFPCKTVEGEKESMHFRPSLFAASKPLVLSFQARNWQYSTTCCQLKIGSYMNLCVKKKVPTRNISLEGDFKGLLYSKTTTVCFSSCQWNLIKTFQIEGMIALIKKMDLIFSWDLLNGQKCPSKRAKIWFPKSIFNVKNHPNLSKIFFCWKISI